MFFIIFSALHVSGSFSARHQELIKLYVQPWVLSCFPGVYRWCGLVVPTHRSLSLYVSLSHSMEAFCYFKWVPTTHQMFYHRRQDMTHWDLFNITMRLNIFCLAGASSCNWRHVYGDAELMLIHLSDKMAMPRIRRSVADISTGKPGFNPRPS